MTGTPPAASRRSRFWFGVLGAAVLIGAWLRLEQVATQVLIDDEWHAVHQFIARTPRDMFFDFGYADYSIPLGILDWYQAQAWGVSELTLRWPMIVCGLATLVVLPLYVAARLGTPDGRRLCAADRHSPLLVIFTRMARPYAITLLLGWVAHGAYQRYHGRRAAQLPAGATYAVAAALATWLHPVVGPFVVAPLLWGSGAACGTRRPPIGAQPCCAGWHPGRRDGRADCRGRAAAAARASRCRSPPRAASTFPDAQTLVGVWYAWLGTPVDRCRRRVHVARRILAPRSSGAPMPAARTGALGIALTLRLVVATGPMWSHLPVTVSRYLLPVRSAAAARRRGRYGAGRHAHRRRPADAPAPRARAAGPGAARSRCSRSNLRSCRCCGIRIRKRSTW